MVIRSSGAANKWPYSELDSVVKVSIVAWVPGYNSFLLWRNGINYINYNVIINHHIFKKLNEFFLLNATKS